MIMKIDSTKYRPAPLVSEVKASRVSPDVAVRAVRPTMKNSATAQANEVRHHVRARTPAASAVLATLRQAKAHSSR